MKTLFWPFKVFGTLPEDTERWMSDPRTAAPRFTSQLQDVLGKSATIKGCMIMSIICACVCMGEGSGGGGGTGFQTLYCLRAGLH